MAPPPARIKHDDDNDIFAEAGTDYVVELPKVSQLVPK